MEGTLTEGVAHKAYHQQDYSPNERGADAKFSRDTAAVPSLGPSEIEERVSHRVRARLRKCTFGCDLRLALTGILSVSMMVRIKRLQASHNLSQK